jgi:hypothetical protein
MSITPPGWNSPEYPPPADLEWEDVIILLSTGEERRGSYCHWPGGSGWLYEATMNDDIEAEIVGWKL